MIKHNIRYINNIRRLADYIDDHLILDRYNNEKKFTGDRNKINSLVKIYYQSGILDQSYNLNSYLKIPEINLMHDLDSSAFHAMTRTSFQSNIKRDLKELNHYKKTILKSHVRNKTNIVKDFRLITKTLTHHKILKSIFYNQMLLDDVYNFKYIDAINGLKYNSNHILQNFFKHVSDPHYSILEDISMGINDIWYYGSKLTLRIESKKRIQRRNNFKKKFNN